MVLTLLPCTAFAADPEHPMDGWCGVGGAHTVHWRLTGTGNKLTLTIKGMVPNQGKMADFGEIANGTTTLAPWYYYKDKITSIVVDGTDSPSGQHQVTHIGAYAFSELSNVTTITLTSNITSIGAYAFQRCTSVNTINLPVNLESIGEGAFQACEALATVNFPYNENKLKSLPDKLFLGCKNLTTINTGGSLRNAEFLGITKIGKAAFKNCAKLKEVYLPSITGSTGLGEEAFAGCELLDHAELPRSDMNSITTIPKRAFYGCASLKYVGYPRGNDANGKPIYQMPISVTTIDEEAFRATNLQNIIIPDAVRTIGIAAYANQKGKPNVLLTINSLTNLPHTDKNYKNGVFNECTLGEVKFENCIKTIPAGLLDGSEIDKVVISRTIGNTNLKGAKIDPEAFSNCTIKMFEVDGYSYSYCTVGGVLYNFDCTELIRYPNGNTWTTACEIPATVKTIKKNAFLGSTALTDVRFAGGTAHGLTTIEDNAFKNCTSLAKLIYEDSTGKNKLPSKLTSIGASAFENTALTSTVVLPSELTSLGTAAFKNVGTMTGVELSDNAKLKTIQAETFMDCGNLTSISISDSITEIGRDAFRNCGKLATLNLSPWLKKIGESAFRKCTGLVEVVFHTELTEIGDYAFEGCTRLKGDYTNPRVLRIPSTVKTVGNYAFQNCTAIEELSMIGGGDPETTIGDGAFQNCSSLAKAELSDRIKSIGAYSFDNDIALNDITLPLSITSISDYMFQNCSALKSIIIPLNVTKINVGAFAYSGLETITLHDKLATIDGSLNKDIENPIDAFLQSSLKTINYVTSSSIKDKAAAIAKWDKIKKFDNSVKFNEAVNDIQYIIGGLPAPQYVTVTYLTKNAVTFDESVVKVKKEADAPAYLSLNQIPNLILDGYTQSGWRIGSDSDIYTSEELTTIPLTTNTLISAVWEPIPVPTYTITEVNGTKATPSTAESGECITITVSVSKNETFIGWDIRPQLDDKYFLDGFNDSMQTTSFYMPNNNLTISPVIVRDDKVIESGKEYLIKEGITGSDGYSEQAIRDALTDYFRSIGLDNNNSFFEIIVKEVTKSEPVGYTLTNSSSFMADLSLAFAAEEDSNFVIIPFPDNTSPTTHTYTIAYYNKKTGAKGTLNYELVESGSKTGLKIKNISSDLAIGVNAKLKSTSTGSGYTKTNGISTDIGSYSASTIASTLLAGFSSSSYTTQLYQIVKKNPNDTSTISVPLDFPRGTNSTNYSFSAYAFNKSNGGRRSIAVTPTSSGLLVEVSEANTAICVGAWRKSSSSDDDYTGDTYSIRDDSGRGGTVKVASKAEAQESVTIRVTPKDGYELKDIVVYDKNDKEITLKERSDDRYTFTMPARNVTVEATFQEIDDNGSSSSSTTNNQALMTASQLFGPGVTGVAGIPDVVAGGTGTVAGTVPSGTTVVNAPIPFTDVANDSSYRTAVGYVYSKGLMAGTNDTTFSPDTSVSRAMVVSILHRLEGSPSAEKAEFEDVEEGEWYEDPIAWASSSGIVSGYTGEDENKFGPTDPVTKEQLVSILARYALLKKYDTVARADISEYKDADNVSQYALGAMQWAAGKDLFAKDNALNLLSPTKDMNRAETADMLMRFCQNVAKIQ